MNINIDALSIYIEENEIQAICNSVENVLRSRIKWTNSDYCRLVEEEMRKITQINYASVVSSGSTALESILIGLDIKNTVIFAPVLTAPPTIVSCLNCDSDIVLVDADSRNFAMSAEHLEKMIKKYYVPSKYKKKGAIILVHIGGIITQDIEKIVNIAKKYDLYLIEDCAHAHGSFYMNKSAGDFGDAAAFSFFLTKTVTSGEGGVIVSANKELISKINMIRNYGKDAQGLHVIRGSSWRMNEFTACVLYHVLQNFPQRQKLRQSIASYYAEFIINPIFVPIMWPSSNVSGYYKYILPVAGKYKGFCYDFFEEYMRNNGVQLPAKVYTRLIVEEPFLKSCDRIKNIADDFVTASLIKNMHICLPIYESLTIDQIKHIVDAVNDFSI